MVAYICLIFCLLIFLLDRMGKRIEARLSSLDEKLGALADLLEEKKLAAQPVVTAEMTLNAGSLCACGKSRIEQASPAASPPGSGDRGFFEATELSPSQGAQTLLINGNDINAMDSIGFTQLDSAIYNGNYAAAETLISKGASVDQKDGFGRTPLHWAAYKGQPDMVRLLLRKVRDINVKHNNGFTPLHVAVAYGHFEVARLLIDSGADVNTRDNDGKTLLDAALEHEHHDIAELLKSHGV